MPDDGGAARPFAHVRSGGAPVSWLGANFWSRSGGPLMWRHYDHALVRSELGVLRQHGVTTTRSFLYWPDVMPEPDRLDEEQLQRFDDFLDLHAELGMGCLPTFVVGHMSGENWDPVWRRGRDLYGDTWMVARQAWYVRTLVSRWKDHPAVAGWLLTNEMPIYGGAAPTSVVTSWAELLVQAVRAGGGAQPVGVGDGAWGIEVTGEDNGFSVRELGELVDFVGPHVYRMESDVVRQHLKSALQCELAAVAGKPVVLEEFGLSSDFASEENAGHYYRQQLHLSLLGGATGWIAWNNTDFDPLVEQDPYRHHPFELHFGLTTSRGQPKSSLLEMDAFRRVLDAVDVTRCRRLPTRTALVVSSYLSGGVPFTDPLDRQLVAGAVEQAHVAAREAGLRPGFVREDEGIAGGYGLYLVPSTKQLTGPSWLRLGELARAGAVVYVSYCAGEGTVQRGPWWTGTEELFGVRNALVYGLAEPIEDDVVHLTFERDLGSLRAGDVLTVAAAGGPEARSYLPVTVTDGDVAARDARGRPAIVTKRHGDGLMVLCTYPLEHMARCRSRVNPEDTWRLYAALAEAAGARAGVVVDNPLVLVDGLVHADGRHFVWFVSESAEPVTVTPSLKDGARLRPLLADDADPPGVVALPPYGVRVMELTASEESE
ncbi:MAG TPA: cellulase family glycosylhydrolase [Actinomycetales bacterium]|nr:cellulase family glycosylhydrolase [Actinomycetales bacterium]